MGYPTAALGAPTTAGQLQMGILEAHLKHIISEQGQMTHEKISTTLSTTQLQAYITLNIDGKSLSLLELLDKGLLDSYSANEKIFLVGRVFFSLSGMFFHIRFSISLTWWFEKNIRDLVNFCATKLNIKTLLPLVHDKILAFCTLVIPPTSPGVDENIYMIDAYKNHLRFDIHDIRIQFILQNEPSPAAEISTVTEGGGDTLLTVNESADGDAPTKRMRRSNTRNQSFTSWRRENPLPDDDVCWSWASQQGPCKNGTPGDCPSGHIHEIPDDCSASDWDSFLTWIDNKP